MAVRGRQRVCCFWGGPYVTLAAVFAAVSVAAFTPRSDDFTSAGSGTETVPSGAAQLVMEVWGGGAAGGAGATGEVDHQGGGGGAGGYSKSIFALVAGDWGKTISYTVGAVGVASSTSGSALNAGAVAVTANPGVAGASATGTTNGALGAGGTASGGNTTNTTGANGVAGNSSGTGGQGGAANNGYAAGGQGGFSISDTGRNTGRQGGRVKFSWT